MTSTKFDNFFFLDIQRRLGELGNKRPTGGEDSSQLLAELRAQEERNQRALDDLKRQLYDINHQRINVMYVNLPIFNIITSVIYMYITIIINLELFCP